MALQTARASTVDVLRLATMIFSIVLALWGGLLRSAPANCAAAASQASYELSERDHDQLGVGALVSVSSPEPEIAEPESSADETGLAQTNLPGSRVCVVCPWSPPRRTASIACVSLHVRALLCATPARGPPLVG